MPTPEGKALLTRWQAMQEAKLKDLRSTSPTTALLQLESMYASVDVLGLREGLSDGELEVREKWIRLQEQYGARP